MEDYVTLSTFIAKHNISNEKYLDSYKKLFYNMDVAMKNLHNTGYYVKDFNINSILVSDSRVYYKNIDKLYYDDRDYLINKNIYYLSSMAIGIYNECLQFIRPDNKASMKENFSYFSSLIPKDMISYYNGIINNNATVYLSDYVDAYNKRINISDVSSSSVNNKYTSEKDKVLVKSTEYGKLFSEMNASAFAMIYIFPAIIFLMAILIPILIIINR